MCFARHLNGKELDIVECFLFELHGQSVNREEYDKVIWKGNSKGKISVKDLYSLLESNCAYPFLLGIILNS